jgi:hypothetical protein
MRKHLFALFALAALGSAPMFAQTDMRLVIDDGPGGNSATFDVIAGAAVPDPLNAVTCPGCVLGAIYTPGLFDTDHGQLLVTGTLGQFQITITGQGGGVNPPPTHQNLNEIDATSTGPGTLTVAFTDTNYTTFGDPFSLSASGTFSTGIKTSTTDLLAFMDSPAPGTIPAGTLIGAFLNVVPNVCSAANCSFALAADLPNPIPGATSGSLTTIKSIDFTGIGSAQVNFTIASQIPEPGSVVLLGTMLLGTGLAMRRRFGKQL